MVYSLWKPDAAKICYSPQNFLPRILISGAYKGLTMLYFVQIGKANFLLEMVEPFETQNPLFGMMVDKLFGGCSVSPAHGKTVCCHINWLYGTPAFGALYSTTCPTSNQDGLTKINHCAKTHHTSVYGCKMPCRFQMLTKKFA